MLGEKQLEASFDLQTAWLFFFPEVEMNWSTRNMTKCPHGSH